jgi:plastocyanin
MRWPGRITRVAVLAGLAAACLPAVPAAGAPRGRALPSRMLVYAQEWSLWPSRSSVPAGKVTVQLWNRGMDAHDLRIRRLNQTGAMIGSVQDVAVTQSGQLHQSTWRLGAGTYELYCSMPGHAARGMRARIRVK